MSKRIVSKLEAELRAEQAQAWQALEVLLRQEAKRWPGEEPATIEAYQELRQQASLELAHEVMHDATQCAKEISTLMKLLPWGEYLTWDEELSQVMKAAEAQSLEAWPDDIPPPPQEPEGVQKALEACRVESASGKVALLKARALLLIARAVRRYHRGERPQANVNIVRIIFDGKPVEA